MKPSELIKKLEDIKSINTIDFEVFIIIEELGTEVEKVQKEVITADDSTYVCITLS